MLTRLTDHPESVSNPGYGQDKSAGRGYDGERLLADHYDGWGIDRTYIWDIIMDDRYDGDHAEAKTVADYVWDVSPGRCMIGPGNPNDLLRDNPENEYVILVVDPRSTEVKRWFRIRGEDVWTAGYGRGKTPDYPTWRQLHALPLLEDCEP